MKITLVAATHFEIASTVALLETGPLEIADSWEVLITGVGSMLTTYALTNHIALSKPSCIIQAGIAGSFSPEHRPGSLVMVKDERMGDLGVEEKGSFRDVFDMQFAGMEDFPFTNGTLSNPYLERWRHLELPGVSGVTVNEISTRADRIDQLKKRYGACIESMEGAALHYVCLREAIPFIQLRSISNFVGERDKNQWRLRQSIEVLNDALKQMITNPQL